LVDSSAERWCCARRRWVMLGSLENARARVTRMRTSNDGLGESEAREVEPGMLAMLPSAPLADKQRLLIRAIRTTYESYAHSTHHVVGARRRACRRRNRARDSGRDGGDDPSHFGDVRCAGGKGKKPTRSSRKLRARALARGDRQNTWVEEQHRCARPPRGRGRRWPRARASGSFGGVELRAALGAMERVPTQLGRFASVAEHSGTCSPNVGERRHQS